MTAQMIEALVNVLLSLLAKASTSSDLSAIIAAIEAYLPAIINAAPAIVEQVQKIISDLMGSADLTDAQMTALLAAKASLDARTDADIAAVIGAAA